MILKWREQEQIIQFAGVICSRIYASCILGTCTNSDAKDNKKKKYIYYSEDLKVPVPCTIIFFFYFFLLIGDVQMGR